MHANSPQIDSRLFNVDSRLFNVDNRLFNVDSRLFNLDSRLFNVDSRSSPLPVSDIPAVDPPPSCKSRPNTLRRHM